MSFEGKISMSISEAVSDCIRGFCKGKNKSVDELSDMTGASATMLQKFRQCSALPRSDEIVRITLATQDNRIISEMADLCGGTFVHGKPAERFQAQEILPNASQCAVKATGMLDVVINAIEDDNISEAEMKAFRSMGKELRGRLEKLSVLMEEKYARDNK